jgi:hypothetical protein
MDAWIKSSESTIARQESRKWTRPTCIGVTDRVGRMDSEDFMFFINFDCTDHRRNIDYDYDFSTVQYNI